MNGITQFQATDTDTEVLDRIINSGDYREPAAQLLARMLKDAITRGGGGIAGPPGPPGDQGVQGPPGPNPIIMVDDRDAVLAYPTQEGLFLQTRSEGKMYFTENYQWVEINNKPA